MRFIVLFLLQEKGSLQRPFRLFLLCVIDHLNCIEILALHQSLLIFVDKIS